MMKKPLSLSIIILIIMNVNDSYAKFNFIDIPDFAIECYHGSIDDPYRELVATVIPSNHEQCPSGEELPHPQTGPTPYKHFPGDPDCRVSSLCIGNCTYGGPTDY